MSAPANSAFAQHQLERMRVWREALVAFIRATGQYQGAEKSAVQKADATLKAFDERFPKTSGS